jgi:hypothetical protein
MEVKEFIITLRFQGYCGSAASDQIALKMTSGALQHCVTQYGPDYRPYLCRLGLRQDGLATIAAEGVYLAVPRPILETEVANIIEAQRKDLVSGGS